jgi:hypothetical protein
MQKTDAHLTSKNPPYLAQTRLNLETILAGANFSYLIKSAPLFRPIYLRRFGMMFGHAGIIFGNLQIVFAKLKPATVHLFPASWWLRRALKSSLCE